MHPSSVMPSSQAAAMGSLSWGKALWLLSLVLLGVAGAFHETGWSMVSIWLRSDTFAHGFLIVPISLWLVWEKRVPLREMHPQPAVMPLLLMLPIGFLWLLAYLVDVLVVQQFAFVGLLMLAIWAVLGTPIARFLAFPIGFLLLGVPVGEGLIYPMMNFTSDFTVTMLRLTGIPVYRDGIFFSIPSGDWSVVEACSGVRYLIASVTLGVLFAYLTYTKTWKRLMFVGVSAIVPVFANGLRAYMIVMLAHLSDMKLAAGVDHLIYGWVFFGLVITILFFIGSVWRDPPAPSPTPPVVAAASGSVARALAIALAAVAIAGLWPTVAWTLERRESDGSEVKLQAPAPSGDWRGAQAAFWDWRPNVIGADGERYEFYADGRGTPVGLYVGVYRTQRQGAELLTSQNQMVVQKHPIWSEKEQKLRPIRIPGEEIDVNQSRLASNREERLLVWSWYRIGNRHTANPYLGKVLEAFSRLSGQRRDGTLIAVAAAYDEQPEAAEMTLQSFVDEMLPAVEQEIDRALQQSP